MSNKIVIVIAVMLVLLGGVWFMYMYKAPGEGAPSAPPPNAVTASNSSDTSLDADLGKIDSQIQGLEGDNAKVDQSMNDKPVEQDNI